MKKWDVLILAAVCVIAAAFLVFLPKGGAHTITVKQNNKTVYEGSLYTNKTIELENNTLIIENGTAYMKEAACKRGVCVHTGRISKKGESIICLPNKVIAEIK